MFFSLNLIFAYFLFFLFDHFYKIEKLKHSLMNAESDSKIQRKKTITLKNAMEQRPSPELIWQKQRENDLLTARIQELESASKVNQSNLLNPVHTKNNNYKDNDISVHTS